MKFASLGSGSSGNATLVCDGDTKVLLDCGFTIKEVSIRLERLGLCPEELTAIVVTHEHSDHIKGVAPFARKYKIPVYMTEGTFASRDFGKLESLHLIRNYQVFTIAGLRVTPVVVPHDAREPAQFIFETAKGVSFGILTDLGSVTPHVIESYKGCDGLLVEANHDLDMLTRGPYPPSLKARVASAWGHLNNHQTAEFLTYMDLENLQQIVVGHISQKNNSIERVKLALADVIHRTKSVRFACQDNGIDWLSLS